MNALRKGFGSCLAAAILAVFTLWIQEPGQAAPPSDHGGSIPRASTTLYGRLPLSFEVNRGQTDKRVKYVAHGAGYTLFLTEGGAVLSLRSQEAGARSQKGGVQPSAVSHQAERGGDVVRLRLIGSSGSARVAGLDELPGKANYFIGDNPKLWHRDIPTYGRVKFQAVYPGVDVVYYGREGELEDDFEVAAGADAGRIGMGIEGAKGEWVDGRGDLGLEVGGGEIYLRRPRAYQQTGHGRREVEVHYELRGGNEVGFALGPYDRKRPLVIDPYLAYSTYLGGTGGDIGYAIAVDANGNAYVTGMTSSSGFPTTTGAYSQTNGGNGDAFVARINPNGSTTNNSSTPQLVYSTFIGGSGVDAGYAITVSPADDAFITGTTSSGNFPVYPVATPSTTPPFQTSYGGGSSDAFVAQLKSDGSSLIYSSYLGGSGADSGNGIAVDSSGNAYVTGSTQSDNFPTVNPLQPTNAGASDAFIAKVNVSGSQILYSTYLGGSQSDVGQAIRLDSANDIFVTGYTYSSDFPLQNPLQGANGGTVNAFLSELKPDGSALLFSTYFGGSTDDRAFGLALDSSGNVYIAGSSLSTNLPTSPSAFQTSNQGGSDAFVAKIKPSGPTLVYSTLLGGTGNDQANGVAVDSSGDAYITGFTQSSNFPLQNPVQSVLGITSGSPCGSGSNPTLCPDAFISEVNPSGSGLLYSTYLGGSGYDAANGIAIDSSGNAYVTGLTVSSNFPAVGGAHNVYQSNLIGVAGNAFVSVINPANQPSISIVPGTLSFGNQTESVTSASQAVTVTNEGTAPLTISSITFSETDGSGTIAFKESDNCVGTLAASGGFCTINITFRPTTINFETGTFSIADNAAGSPHTINVNGTGVTAATEVTVTPTSLSFGNETVGQTSTAQSVTITNTGSQALTINKISASGDFSETDTCAAFLNLLNVGQSCTVSVAFAPTTTGARSGSLSINDTATGSPQTVALTGTGLAQFALSSPSPTDAIVVGSTGATFKISATSTGSSFGGAISLACPSTLTSLSSSPTCTWSPSSTILAGQTVTLTISNLPSDGSLAANNDDIFHFAVTGSSGGQSTTVNLTLLYEDYSLSSSPPSNSVIAGTPASYTLTLTPINGFSKTVKLACGVGMPVGASCSFSAASVTPSGGPVTSLLTIQTTRTTSLPPAFPPGTIPPLAFAVLALAILAMFVSARKLRHSPKVARARWLRLQVAVLGLVILLDLFAVSCRPVSPTGPTTPNNYFIEITGTLNSNTSVVRTMTVDLTVACTPGSTSCT